MNTDRFSADGPDITAEACSWIAQLETGRMSSKDLEALKEWMGRSPRHLAEIRKVARVSAKTNVLADMASSISAAAIERRSAVLETPPWRRFFPQAAIAGVALALALTISVQFMAPTTPGAEPIVIATEIGGYGEETLEDGSTVRVNTDSEIEIAFDKKWRQVRLLRGEAFFDVAHDPARPFTVHAGDKVVQAIGTAFAVRWTDGDLSVTVSEGRVAYAPTLGSLNRDEIPSAGIAGSPDAINAVATVSPANPVMLSAGQKLSIPIGLESTTVAAVATREIESELSWRDGLLEFSQRPLGEIIDEVNRYTDVRIEIEDSDLGQLEFGGIFRIGETEPVFEALELAFDVEVDRLSEKHVRIRKISG